MRIKKITHIALFVFTIAVLELGLFVAYMWITENSTELRFNSWPTAEWLINYNGGFVRRGLAGQIFYWLGAGQNLIRLVSVSAFILYVIYVIIFLAIYWAAKIKNLYVLMLSILIPGGIFQMGFTIQFFTRKEIVFLILFGALCLVYLVAKNSVGKKNKVANLSLFLIAILGGGLCTLIHEGYLFLSYPTTVILLWRGLRLSDGKRPYQLLFITYIILMPALFLLCSLNHGHTGIANQIWDSLSLGDRIILSPSAPYTAFGPISSIGWGLEQHFLTLYGILATDAYLYWPIYILGNTLILIFITLQISAQSQASSDSFLLTVLLVGISSSAMFFIAADWGRWLSFLCNNLLLLAFTLSTSNGPRLQTIEIKELKPFQFLSKFFTNHFGFIFILLILYSLVFRLPECCLNPEYLFMPYSKLFLFNI